MDYKRIYEEIINKAKLENRNKKENIYYEKHHILPKCLGGLNNKENLVLLTAKEHFICHKLLVKIYPDNNKLIYALSAMMFFKRGKRIIRIGAREFEKFKIEFIKAKSINDQEYFKTNTIWNKGIPRSQETIDKIKKTKAGNGYIMSDETKAKIGKSSKGRVQSAETIEKRVSKLRGENNPMYGRTGINHHSFGEKMTPYTPYVRKKIECPYCLKIGGDSNMRRYHFENCKLKPNIK